MDKRELSSRDKNDIFWIKKRKYNLSAAIKCRKEDGVLNPDTAAEVREAYRRLEGKEFAGYLTGHEFSDHPPTTSGQSSFAASVAGMMRLLEYLDTREFRDSDSGPFSDYFLEIFEEGKSLIREILEAFFLGCGEEREGLPELSLKEKRYAQDLFFKKRIEYESLIRTENRIAGCSMMEEIRLKNGIGERMETDADGRDPAFERLVEEHPAEYENRKKEIEELCACGRSAYVEAAERMAARKALKEAVSRIVSDTSTDEFTRRTLMSAYLNDSFDVDLHLRRLLYRREAAYYQARWYLTGEPVDAVIGEVIAEISSEKPRFLDGNTIIHNVPGFIEPKEPMGEALPELIGPEALFQAGEEILSYVRKHPGQFEAQCLLSVITGTEALPALLEKSWAVTRRIDSISMDAQLLAFSEDDRRRLLDLWVLSDKVCRIGHILLGLVTEIRDATVEEGTRILRDTLPSMSFFAMEQKTREVLEQIFAERYEKGKKGGGHASE